LKYARKGKQNDSDTFDVPVLAVGEGVLEGRATEADTYLHGAGRDQRVAHWIFDGFEKEHGVHLGESPVALQRRTKAVAAGSRSSSDAVKAK
jgi:molecular chaperone DnaK (HSP70)